MIRRQILAYQNTQTLEARFKFKSGKMIEAVAAAENALLFLKRPNLNEPLKRDTIARLRTSLVEARDRWHTILSDREKWEEAIVQLGLGPDDVAALLDDVDERYANLRVHLGRLEEVESELKRYERAETADPRLFKPESIKIKPFKGLNHEVEYHTFKRNFQAIYGKLKIEDCQRFQYLMQHVENDAYKAICGLPPDDASYKRAFEILDSRYGDVDLVINKLTSELLSLRPIPKSREHDMKLLRTQHDQIYTIFTRMQDASPDQANETHFWMRFLDGLYSYDVKKHAYEKEGKPPRNGVQRWLDVCGEKINEETRLRDQRLKFHPEDKKSEPRPPNKAVNLAAKANPRSSAQKQGQGKSGGQPKGANGNRNQSGHSNPVACPVCKKSHFINKCEAFKALSYKDKRAKVRELDLCWSCLRSGHRCADCRFVKPCGVKVNGKPCGAKTHHYLMHAPKGGDGKKSSSQS